MHVIPAKDATGQMNLTHAVQSSLWRRLGRSPRWNSSRPIPHTHHFLQRLVCMCLHKAHIAAFSGCSREACFAGIESPRLAEAPLLLLLIIWASFFLFAARHPPLASSMGQRWRGDADMLASEVGSWLDSKSANVAARFGFSLCWLLEVVVQV